jgi:hypothetical protein
MYFVLSECTRQLYDVWRKVWMMNKLQREPHIKTGTNIPLPWEFSKEEKMMSQTYAHSPS